MSPRRNHPRRPGRGGRPTRAVDGWDPYRAVRGADTVESFRGEQWRVRQIPGTAAVKVYRCPGCDHEIRPGVPHVVAWPVSGPPGTGGEAERRHWHSGCWRARERRRPAR